MDALTTELEAMAVESECHDYTAGKEDCEKVNAMTTKLERMTAGV